MGWKPIITAPKDGTPILVFDAGVRDALPYVVEWNIYGSVWVGADKHCWSPDYWMPLPSEPSISMEVMDRKQELWNAVETFIKDQDIHCSETIYQTDRVIESAYGFIDELCQIVGFLEEDK